MYPIVAAAALAAAVAEQSPNPIVPNWSEFIVGGLSFLILLGILSKVAFPRAGEALRQRTANIEGKLEHAEQERQQAEALLKEYQDKLASAADDAQRVLDEARAAAERARRDLTAKAEQEAQRIVERAQVTIRQERDQALATLRREVGTLAVELATRVVGDSLDRERQLRLVDQYIDELGAQGSGDGGKR